MEQGRVSTTPTGYGVIRVDARKQITVPTVDAPTFAQPAAAAAAGAARLAARARARGAASAPRVAPAQ